MADRLTCVMFTLLIVTSTLAARQPAPQEPPAGAADTLPVGNTNAAAPPLTSLQSPAGSPGSAQAPATAAPAAANNLRLDYVLGPDDSVLIRAYDMEEQISEGPYLVGANGTITLPVLGDIQAGGFTIEHLENVITDKMRKYVRIPHSSVVISRFRSEPVFVEGQFRTPGIYQLQDHKTLLELITAVGLPSDASHRIKITRRREYGVLPFANAVEEKGAKTSTAEVDITKLRDGTSLEGDLDLRPYDVISATREEMVYVLGEVGRVGPLDVGDRDSISILQALSMAGGLGKDARPNKALVLRPTPEANHRTEIAVDIRKILSTKAEDFALRPNDILYVPGGNQKVMLERAALIALPMIPTFAYLFLR